MKFRFKLIFVTLIFLILAMGCSNDQDKKLSHFNKGNDYFEAKEYKKAETVGCSILEKPILFDDLKMWLHSLGV